jgi:outer membrane murein-binding lipoprotein Lpp
MPGKHGLRALLALAAAGVALSGCGSDEISGEIPATNAGDLNTALAALSAATEQTPPDCLAARSRADQFVATVNLLPATAGEAKEELQGAAAHLRELVDAECPDTDTSGSPTTSSTTTSDTTDTTSTEPTTTTTDTDTTTTTTTEEPPPDDGGGKPSDGGPPDGDGTGGTGGTPGGGSDNQ